MCSLHLVKSHFLNICFQKKYEKFLEPSEKAKVNRSHSSGSLKALKALSSARRYSEEPKVHYTATGPTDVSNNTQTTLGMEFSQV